MSAEPESAPAPAPVASSSKRKASAPPQVILSRERIREGDNVLIRLPSGVLKAIKISLKSYVEALEIQLFASS